MTIEFHGAEVTKARVITPQNLYPGLGKITAALSDPRYILLHPGNKYRPDQVRVIQGNRHTILSGNEINCRELNNQGIAWKPNQKQK